LHREEETRKAAEAISEENIVPYKIAVSIPMKGKQSIPVVFLTTRHCSTFISIFFPERKRERERERENISIFPTFFLTSAKLENLSKFLKRKIISS